MGKRAGDRCTGPKCIAIVGPFASGKTTLFEAILARSGAIVRQNPTGSGQTVGDHSPEARAHAMSVEAVFATTEFMGETITFVDCPGSLEFAHEAAGVLGVCDLAVVVVEPDEKKFPALQQIVRELDRLAVPRIFFLNKIDKASLGVRDTLKLLQPASAAPLLLRQIALRENGIVVGSIDLALERAYIYREHAESTIAEIPDDQRASEIEARFQMLETLADHDDGLMEQLLEEIEPPRDAVFDDLAADLREGRVTPVLIGAAEHGNGVLRLLKTIRHDAPDISLTRRRLDLPEGLSSAVAVMKTVHTPHGGKLSMARVLAGSIVDGAELGRGDKSDKVSGIYRMLGKDQTKLARAGEGETVALGKLDHAATGDILTASGKDAPARFAPPAPPPVHALAVKARERKDDVKLTASLARICEEDPSLALEQNQESGETIVSGHGEMHLRVAMERLANRYQVAADMKPPAIPYRETIRQGVSQRGRHKKQSGGHGQFGDVMLEIKPLPRGAGFAFTDTITGGVVPKQYIPSVEAGVREALKAGALGFPVVDIAVNLSEGSYHSVDSSDMAFQMAARLAMREGLAAAAPVLLEPIHRVDIFTPSEATPRITAIVSQRRGQILGFNAREGWQGWDVVSAMMPQGEMRDLIVELRSATFGVASYAAAFDHMAELSGRQADEVQAQTRAA